VLLIKTHTQTLLHCHFTFKETHLHDLLDALECAHRNTVLCSARVLAGGFHSLGPRKLAHHLCLQSQRAAAVAVLAARAEQLPIWANVAGARPAGRERVETTQCVVNKPSSYHS
jgi:hypothetical protein